MNHRLNILSLCVCLAIAFIAVPASATSDDVPVTKGEDGVCVTVFDFPDNGLTYCVDADGDCTITERRTTIAGSQERCILG